MSSNATVNASAGAGARRRRRRAALAARLAGALAAALASVMLAPGSAPAFNLSFIAGLHEVSSIGTTQPANKDENPYGIAVVQHSIGALVGGDILISNFNNFENLQGTGTTLVELTPSGELTEFAQINAGTLPGSCPGGVGLTTALAILPDGYVVVGSLPSSNGQAETAQAGCLIVLNPDGRVVKTISGKLINGPWDLTAVSFGDSTTLFVTNVLNGTGETVTEKGTVLRIGLVAPRGREPFVISERVIATGFPEVTSPTAFVIGPTGVGLGAFGTLYVADTKGNRIAAVPFALSRQHAIGGGGITVSEGGHLNGPLGLAIAPNGDILTTNSGDGNIVETTPFGDQLAAVDTGAGEGGLFGLAVSTHGPGVYFVDDANNTLGLLH